MTFTAEDEKAYLELINKVAEYDIQAAVYMQSGMRKIEGFEPDGNLYCVVYWEDTTQGHDYWYELTQKIGQ